MSLTENDRQLIATLLPVTFLLEDFTHQYEYMSPAKETIMGATELINKLNLYTQRVYETVGISDEDFKKLAEEIKPAMEKFNADNTDPRITRIWENNMGDGEGGEGAGKI